MTTCIVCNLTASPPPPKLKGFKMHKSTNLFTVKPPLSWDGIVMFNPYICSAPASPRGALIALITAGERGLCLFLWVLSPNVGNPAGMKGGGGILFAH
ncbi:hypothetical protein XELAEV_18047887mg [Xenopus laevis]|uniref:Uncharacterized protein n=1 Tax=Xenopus laevis TaxID=8355 RepID=A0A974BWC9_XENLA|nr:hypothetical protein XELAEV_18047887mg [Xenopus laevis]